MATLIHRCGCSIGGVTIPDNVDEYTIEVPSQTKEVFRLRFKRTSSDVFVDARDPTPDWARGLHQMIPLDVKSLKGLTQVGLVKVLAIISPWSKAVGYPCVPICMLPELMRGSGRFYGVWRNEEIPGVQHKHLRLVQKETL